MQCRWLVKAVHAGRCDRSVSGQMGVPLHRARRRHRPDPGDVRSGSVCPRVLDVGWPPLRCTAGDGDLRLRATSELQSVCRLMTSAKTNRSVACRAWMTIRPRAMARCSIAQTKRPSEAVEGKRGRERCPHRR